MGSFTGRNPIRMKITRKAPFPQVGDGARLVELRGFEPLTFSLRTRRATNCATAPRAGYRLAPDPGRS